MIFSRKSHFTRYNEGLTDAKKGKTIFIDGWLHVTMHTTMQPQTRNCEQRNKKSLENNINNIILNNIDKKRKENCQVEKAFQNNQTTEAKSTIMYKGHFITSAQMEKCGKRLNFQKKRQHILQTI